MITSPYFTLAILMMACITFAVRYAFFARSINLKLYPQFKRLLVFTAPCILTAMVIPIMFQDGLANNLNDSLNNDLSLTNINALLNSSYFWAGLLAIGLSLMIRQTLLVIVLSMAGFYALRYFGLG